MRTGAEVRSIRAVEYLVGETVPANTSALVLEVADVEGFIVVEWHGRTGLYSVHVSDIEQTRPPEIQ